MREGVDEFVYMPAQCMRALLMVDGYANTAIDMALNQKFRFKATLSTRPAAVKRDSPKVVNHCPRPVAVKPEPQCSGLSRDVGGAALGPAVHDDSGGMAVSANFGKHFEG
ncbi:hypothetical protein AC1031_000563 [Aphanomyces cochlioides]|nr:hypothetical protein AC1031_000563 [Aphanomyces cochlioides]